MLNRLAAGRYDVGCWVGRNNSVTDVAMHAPHALNFVVYGQDDVVGLVALDNVIEVGGRVAPEQGPR